LLDHVDAPAAASATPFEQETNNTDFSLISYELSFGGALLDDDGDFWSNEDFLTSTLAAAHASTETVDVLAVVAAPATELSFDSYEKLFKRVAQGMGKKDLQLSESDRDFILEIADLHEEGEPSGQFWAEVTERFGNSELLEVTKKSLKYLRNSTKRLVKNKAK
jgi:hypothetical protein